jgi:hypothetical protein
MANRVALLGLVIWIAGTVAIRLIGQHLLQPRHAAFTIALYAASFVAMVILVRWIFGLLRLPRESWPLAATILIAPTLILDPFSCLFFPTLFPNIDPSAAGLFGGCMLICCGGGVAGSWLRR